MTANSLFPSYVKIDYHSAFGTHVMTLPTRQWSPDVGNALGQFEDWTGGNRNGADMVTDLVTLFAPFFKDDTNFDLATVYNYDDPDADPNPVTAMGLDIAGTSISTAWSKAVQTTFTFRSLSFGIAKLVFLDAPSGNQFDRISGLVGSPEADAIFNNLKLDSNAWAARDNGRIGTFIQISYTLNEKLRREYHMN